MRWNKFSLRRLIIIKLVRRMPNDGSFSVNAGAMIEAKESRKRTENDLQLVANRIALLRYEEQVIPHLFAGQHPYLRGTFNYSESIREGY
jgi:hypothetical protein